MRRVQMLVQVSGGRGDGTQWPPPGGILEAGEEEAAHLVAARLARYAPEDEAEARPAPDDAEKRPARQRPASKPAEA